MESNSANKTETSEKSTSKVRTGKPEVEHEEPAQEHPVSVQPVEPTDPRMTGSSKPEQREVLQDNVNENGAAKPHPDSAPGQHSTGSFTDEKPHDK